MLIGSQAACRLLFMCTAWTVLVYWEVALPARLANLAQRTSLNAWFSKNMFLE
jgi:hypothetical protein